MQPAPLPPNETQRLKELHACRLLDTEPESSFDQIAQLAAYICQTPIALISLIDQDRQWFKAKVGLTVRQTSREAAFCAHAILQETPLIVPDALQDERFVDNPLVTGDPKLRFYAGVPLITSQGLPLGTLCVLDSVPRHLDMTQIATLQQLAALAVQHIEQRRSLRDLERTAIRHQPRLQKRYSFLTTIATGFAGAAAILISLGITGQQTLNRYFEASRWQDEHYQILEHLYQLDICLHSTIAAQSYDRAGDPQAQLWMQQSGDCVQQALAQARQSMVNWPDQMARINALKPKIQAKLAAPAPTSAPIARSQPIRPTQVDPSDSDDLVVIQTQVRELQQVERQRITAQTGYLTQSNQVLIQTFGIAIICNLLISTLLFRSIYREMLERKRAEHILEQERDFSAAVIDTVDALVIVLDGAGKIIRFNHICEKISGYTYAEVQNRFVWDILLPPEEIDSVQSTLMGYITGQLSGNYENHWLTRSGERRLISWSATPLTNPDGSVAYLIGTGSDITDRRRVEQRRNAQYALTRILAQSITLPEAMAAILATLGQRLDWDLTQFWCIDQRCIDQRCIDQQQLRLADIWHCPAPAFAELAMAAQTLRFSPGEGLAGWVWQQQEPIWIADIAQNQQLTHQQDLLAAGLRQALGFPIWGNDRPLGVITLFVTGHIHKPDADLMELLTAIGRQIGQFVERKQTEADIQRQHIRSQLLSAMTLRIRQSLDLSEILKTTVSEVREYLQADRVLFYRLEPDRRGIVVAESVEANWSSCLGTDSLTPCFQSLERLYQQGQVSMLANLDEADLSETQRQILTQFQVQSHLVVPISEDDQLWGLLVAHQCGKPRQWQPAEVNFLLELANQVGLAISQAHLLAQETQQRQQLAQQNLELQQARSAAEQAKQIAIQSCKTAEQAAQVKSAFLATMSHEIRTPLNALLGISELLNYTNLDAQQQEFVDLIQSSGDTLLSLINNVLDFSKLEAKDIELELLEFDLWDCLEEVTGILANTAYMKGLEMAIVVDPNLPVRIRGDLSRIRQVLTNLVGNAIKFTAQGDVIVRVSLTDQAELKFAVQDTGIGIPTLDQAMLFQPFTQVDASTTRKYGGTGLGLAICKQVVECMGGTIGLESQVEQGSTFWFTIPLEPAVSPPVASQRTDRMQMSSRILVIAANTAVRSMIRSQTQDWQVQVDEAANLPAGWHQLQQMAEQESGDYAAVLIDLHSREDWQNWQSLRQTCSAQTRFIGLIAPSDLSKMQSQLDREQIEYLVKPVRRSRLYYQILGCPPPSQLPPFNCPTLAAADLITTVNSTVSDLRILLVEDNEINRMVALKQLCQLGYHADVASNGQAALKQLAKQTYDLVLMDCQMPIMDGFTATEYIRKRQVIDYSPVIIAITANATLQDRQYCLDAGMDDYLSKPIQQEDLRQALAYWSEQIAQQRALPASIANAQPLAISLRRHPSSPINFPTTSQPTVTELNGADAIDSMEPLLDWSYLHRLSNGNLTFERELLQTLVNSLPSHIHNLKTHLATGNLSGLHQEAHYIKGASGSVGIQGIVQSAAAIEQWAQQQHLEPIPRQIQQLEHHFNRIVQFLSHQSYQPVGRPESA